MSRWWRIDSSAVDAVELIRLTDRQFKRKFYAALAGELNEFTPFIRRTHGRPEPKEWAALRSQVFSRDDYTCRYCGDRGRRLECDHVFPLSRGGGSSLNNLVTACRPCNRAKRDKTPEEWQR